MATIQLLPEVVQLSQERVSIPYPIDVHGIAEVSGKGQVSQSLDVPGYFRLKLGFQAHVACDVLKEDLGEARKLAELELLNMLYANFRGELHQLRYAIMNNDRRAAAEHVNKLLDATYGKKN